MRRGAWLAQAHILDHSQSADSGNTFGDEHPGLYIDLKDRPSTPNLEESSTPSSSTVDEHEALREAERFPVTPITPRRQASRLARRLADALQLDESSASQRSTSWLEEAAASAERLRPFARALRKSHDSIRAATASSPRRRRDSTESASAFSPARAESPLTSGSPSATPRMFTPRRARFGLLPSPPQGLRSGPRPPTRRPAEVRALQAED